MRPDRPLILAVASLATGVSLILAYCQGATSMNIAFPFSASALHIALTTNGPAVVGGITLTGIGVLLLVWSFFAAIVHQISLLLGNERQPAYMEREREQPFEDSRTHYAHEDYPGSLGLSERRHEG